MENSVGGAEAMRTGAPEKQGVPGPCACECVCVSECVSVPVRVWCRG